MKAGHEERGLALIGVIILSALLMALAVALSVSVNSDTQLRGAFSNAIGGFYAAEAGLNKGMGTYKNIFLQFEVPEGSDFNAQTLTLQGRHTVYQLHPSSKMMTGCPDGQSPPCPKVVTIPSGEIFGGLNAIQYTYTVNSQAIAGESDVQAAVGAEFLVGYIPMFQFMAFYKDDLEIAPGATMRLQGRVHTNSNLYLGSGNGALFIEDNPAAGVRTIQVSAGGKIYRGRKRANECLDDAGKLTIDMLEDKVSPFGDLDPRVLDCYGNKTAEVPASDIAKWKGSIKAEIQNISIPEPDIIQRGGDGVFWKNADLRIILDVTGANAVFEVQDANGNVDAAKTASLGVFMNATAWNAANSTLPGTYPVFMTDVPIACADSLNRTCYTPNFASTNRIYTSNMTGIDPAAARDFRRGGFYNWREARWMLLLNLNLADLIRWNGQNGDPFFHNNDATDGGLVIFLSIQGPNSNVRNNYGVRVFGSALIPLDGGIGVSADPTGVTVVSDQAVYVLGDYNSTAPRQPAALIGDSVNVLSSNYWKGSVGAGACADPCAYNDNQSDAFLNDVTRDGATTRINAAFLGGVDMTPDGFPGAAGYNGGLENYPRFHEDWGGAGAALNYQGSYVSLGTPKHVAGAWCGTGGDNTGGCNIYNPPSRNWNFDPAFNDAANLPPLTPRFVYVQQVLFTEDFK
jgi:hypothetical protein